MKASTIITIAFASVSAAQFRIGAVESGAWLKAFPRRPSQPSTPVILDKYFASVYERWDVANQDRGYTMMNVGTGDYISCDDNSCKASTERTTFQLES